jgi:hypothetical protein
VGGICAAAFLSSCGQQQKKNDATSSPDSSVVQVENIEEGPHDAVAVVQEYYDAINARDYERAYRCWGEAGPRGQTLEDFIRGFAKTASARVVTGMPSRIDAAAGSRYIEVPVEIFAKTTSGDEQHFAGKYILRRAVVDGATPAQRHWHFYQTEIHRVTSAPDSGK